ncbi:hypothetical protein [Pseudomonas aeruginosa]|uniref:hypothetical protein n=1 Tax=Pseudomonas aeruginosa TaxID=287 RepID=UPI001C962234|nr:hypothetical protein [Pseudomonas aeruginosa]MBX6276980.1 hypothetical protein [Pseudomonas aeruginosa]WGT19128.1 hypothetical protein P4N66_gene5237 [Pseudomonas aeruginosa]
MSAISEYREALQRLIINKPINIPTNSAINKDTVALEAGRKRGSIKRSRAEHAQLISEIEAAASIAHIAESNNPTKQYEKQKHLKSKAIQDLDKLKKSYELALTKIVSLEHENHALKKELNTLRESAIVPSKVVGLIKPR